MSSSLHFEVPGVPAPKGSHRYLGRGRVIDDNPRTRPWQELVAVIAQKSARQQGWTVPDRRAPLAVSCVAVFPRPKAHFGKGGLLRPDMPVWHTTRPDLDKVLRALLDALTLSGAVWADDAQAVKAIGQKWYVRHPETPRLIVHVTLAGAA